MAIHFRQYFLKNCMTKILKQLSTKHPENIKRRTYFVSSITSTSAGAVMGAFERPAVGSSVFSSPFVELTT